MFAISVVVELFFPRGEAGDVGWVGGAKFTAGVVHIISAKFAPKYMAYS